MMGIFRFELKLLRVSVLGWCVALCCLLGIYIGMYPLFQNVDFDVAGLYARFPETLQTLFGMENLEVRHMTGYLAFPMKLAQELAAIGGFILGVRTANHDTREKSGDFLYSKPVSRQAVIWAKAGTLFVIGVILLVVQAVFLRILTGLVVPGEMRLWSLVVSSLVTVLIFWLYGAAGLAVGTKWPRIRGATAIAVCGTFSFHIVSSVCKVITRNAGSIAVRILVPVAMFDRSLAAQGRLEWPFLLLWLGETAVLLVIARRIAVRRDIAPE